VTDPALRQRIIDECLSAYLHDNQHAWELLPDGRYVTVASLSEGKKVSPLSAQTSLMQRYGQ
jgi:polyphosphate kinase